MRGEVTKELFDSKEIKHLYYCYIECNTRLHECREFFRDINIPRLSHTHED